MKVTSDGIIKGQIEKRFGGFGEQKNCHGLGNYSLPFKVSDYPMGTACFALLFEDKDAFPVTGGFSWIHWTACNIRKAVVRENESVSADFLQGVNSYISIQGGSLPRADCIGYCAPSPPDAPHIYELHVYALDAVLDLQNGFNMNEMFRKMEGHVLDKATIKGVYPNNRRRFLKSAGAGFSK